jgi:hypothetical protein
MVPMFVVILEVACTDACCPKLPNQDAFFSFFRGMPLFVLLLVCLGAPCSPKLSCATQCLELLEDTGTTEKMHLWLSLSKVAVDH